MQNRRLEIRLKGYGEQEEREWKELQIEFPLYTQCYKDALTAVFSNINYNMCPQKEDGSVDIAFAGMEKEYSAPLENSNIIAFIGDRGSGKTTALNEFCRILHGYHNNREKWEPRLACKGEGGYRFHVLAPIDASVLGAKEDLMEVILASMYQVFQKKTEDYKKNFGRSELIQTIIRDFDDVYRDYINVGNHDENQKVLGESVLAKLKYISNSLKTKNSMKKLTEDFLNLLDKRDGEKSFLVIVIDDLDMSPENGYEMLEQLHKYPANQRIIILVAIKYEQMKIICNQHFVDCMTPEYGGIHREIFDNFYKKAKRLSSDYLLKVIPLSNRIYMPESNLLDKRGMIIEPSDKYKVKEFILMKIAAKMDIFYDAKGLKRHFCLPATVRELVSYNAFLDSLHSTEEIEQQENSMVLYDENHERFNGDIEYRMAIRILDDEQLEVYRLIMERNIERRAKYAVNFLKSWMEEKRNSYEKEKNNKKTLRLRDRVDDQKYSYGDLLEVIYNLGRDDYSDKVLVHCILASFTSEMVREYYCYKNGKIPPNVENDENNRTQENDVGEAAKRLKSLLGSTFGGEWFGKEVPALRSLMDSGTETTIGYIPNGKMSEVKIEMMAIISASEDKMGCMKRLLEKAVSDIGLLMLFLSNFRDSGGKEINPEWKCFLNLGETESGYGIVLEISSNVERADFDIFGFIGKELEGQGTGGDDTKATDNKELRFSIEFAKSARQQLYDYDEKGIKKIIKKLEAEAIKKLAETLGRKNTGARKVIFPFYNLDMSYNIMKRVRSRLKENIQLREAEVYDYFCAAYGYIASELKKEEQYYTALLGKGKVPQYYDDFVNSSYLETFELKVEADKKISLIHEQKPEEKKKWREFWVNVIRSLGTGSTKPTIDDQNISGF